MSESLVDSMSEQLGGQQGIQTQLTPEDHGDAKRVMRECPVGQHLAG